MLNSRATRRYAFIITVLKSKNQNIDSTKLNYNIINLLAKPIIVLYVENRYNSNTSIMLRSLESDIKYVLEFQNNTTDANYISHYTLWLFAKLLKYYYAKLNQNPNTQLNNYINELNKIILNPNKRFINELTNN